MASSREWTDEEQDLLDSAILKSVSILDRREKWKHVADLVGTRDAATCEARFHSRRRKEAAANRSRDGWSSGWWSSEGGWDGWSKSGSSSGGGRGRGNNGDAKDGDKWWEGSSGWKWSSGWQDSSNTWQEGEAWDEQKSKEDAEWEALDENQRRALQMKKEVEANRERMRQQEERKKEEESKKEAKKAAEFEEVQKKRREHAEAQEKQYKEALDKKKALHEQEIQRQQEAKREAERTDVPFFGNHRSPVSVKAKPAAPRGGWAAAAGSHKGLMQRQRKEDEIARRSAEVLANLGLAKISGQESEEGSEEEVLDAATASAPSRPIAAPPARQSPASKDDHDEDTKPGKGKGKSKGKDKGKKKHKPMWWEKIESSTVCPISLAPICELPGAPFALEAAGSEAIHYYDARFLANFLVSSCDFIDPINRRELTLEECKALDDHLRQHHPENASVSVADAFSLFEVNGRGATAASDDGVQREATAVLQHLFRFQSARRTDRSGHAINYAEGGLTVVDDDDVLTAPAPMPTAAHSDVADTGDDYPDLLGNAAASNRSSGSTTWTGRSKASAAKPPGQQGDSEEAFPGLPSSAKPKSVAAKAKGAAPKSSSKASSSSKSNAKAGRGGGALGKIHQPKAWGTPK